MARTPTLARCTSSGDRHVKWKTGFSTTGVVPRRLMTQRRRWRPERLLGTTNVVGKIIVSPPHGFVPRRLMAGTQTLAPYTSSGDKPREVEDRFIFSKGVVPRRLMAHTPTLAPYTSSGDDHMVAKTIGSPPYELVPRRFMARTPTLARCTSSGDRHVKWKTGFFPPKVWSLEDSSAKRQRWRPVRLLGTTTRVGRPLVSPPPRVGPSKIHGPNANARVVLLGW
jgi:hypothetical protein